MTAKSSGPPATPPSLPPERAYVALKKQLESLKQLEGRNYQEAHIAEQEWANLTQSLVEKTFGNPSSNLTKYYHARSAGVHQIVPYQAGIQHGRLQANFISRLEECGAFLRSCLSELELELPELEVKGVYLQGEEYEFYRDLKTILQLGTKNILIIDPYANEELFDVYAAGISRQVGFRLLTTKVQDALIVIARKYAAGGRLALRSSDSIHDRVIFVDERVWLAGQSLKDAAKKKPTYIVEHDPALMRAAYEPIWDKATVII